MSDDFVTGQKTGDYEVLGVLGAGGMGKVYKVRNTISDRVEAMKVILANPASQKELADRFLREIKVLASLNHPNIAALRTALTIDNRLVMIMEYVEGQTLASRLEQGPIPAADAVNYVSQILSALSYAHGLGVIHRDLKPANMILTPSGVVKLMDFGIARPNNDTSMTMTGTALGSLNYMSPEQVKGEPVDPRSDLYSLGVSLYELVTGQLPFRGHSNYSVMSAHLQDAPEPPITVRPDLPQGLNDIILMSMAKDPKSRFQSAEAFRNALKSVMPGAVHPAPMVAAVAVNPTPARPLATTMPVAPATPAPAPPISQPATVTQPAALAGSAAESEVAAAEYRVPPASGGQRGIYMALGGVLVLAMLAGAAIYLPKHAKTQANAPFSPAAPTSAPAAPTTNPTSSTDSVAVGNDGSIKITSSSGPGASPAAPASEPAPAPGTLTAPAPPAPAPAPVSHGASPSTTSAAAKQAQQAAAAQAAQAADADRQAGQEKEAALADEEKQTDQLNARAASISQGLDTLRRGQAAQGLGLRGDIASAEELMKTNLTRAQGAIDRRDPDKAKEYLDIAEAQAEKIERFLGR